jgi:hypothetical protein
MLLFNARSQNQRTTSADVNEFIAPSTLGDTFLSEGSVCVCLQGISSSVAITLRGAELNSVHPYTTS